MDDTICITVKEYEEIMKEIQTIKEYISILNEKIDHDRKTLYKDKRESLY